MHELIPSEPSASQSESRPTQHRSAAIGSLAHRYRFRWRLRHRPADHRSSRSARAHYARRGRDYSDRSYAEFTELEHRLFDLGFHRRDAAPICRWFADDLILDLMPTDASILGFTNRWYKPALEHAKPVRLGEHEIRVTAAPYFLSTKLEAFHGRGKQDFQMSHDLEDIITIVDGRPELVKEIAASPKDLREYLGAEFRSLLATPAFRDGPAWSFAP